MSINVQVFGSTSSGNATLVWNSSTAILIDCGLGLKYTSACLAAHGMEFEDLSGVLLTHVHRDHVNGYVLRRLAAANVPLFCSNRHLPHLRKAHESARGDSGRSLLTRFHKECFDIGTFRISPFAVQHDAPGGTCGYRIDHTGESGVCSATVSTDLGLAGDTELASFIDADIIVLESNHDPELLRRSGRPAWLQARIRRAHLSNEEAAMFLARAASNSMRPPQTVLLAHISQHCNTNELALSVAAHHLDSMNIRIEPTFISTPSPIVEAA